MERVSKKLVCSTSEIGTSLAGLPEVEPTNDTEEDQVAKTHQCDGFFFYAISSNVSVSSSFSKRMIIEILFISSKHARK